jgi:hypothetical protein
MLVSIVALAFVTAIASNAQSRGGKLTADIPFDFVVGNKTLAAGEYVVGKATTNSNDAVLVRSSDGGGPNAIRMTNAISVNASKKRTTLTFLRYGNTYYLSQVWIAGSAQGRELLKSKSLLAPPAASPRPSPSRYTTAVSGVASWGWSLVWASDLLMPSQLARDKVAAARMERRVVFMGVKRYRV